VADGDRMGKALRSLQTAERHRRFSRELSRFATKARDVVEKDHRGVLVYAGGDDVVAFLCVADALACAAALRTAFEGIMVEAVPIASDDGAAGRPTLSVGIGIGHILESMGDLLGLGRRAERLAKRGASAEDGSERNALALLIEKRAGGAIAW